MHGCRKQDGFSLLELIVVIAILSVLSGMAVVGYAGYLTHARNASAESFLQELRRNLVLANAEAGGIDTIEIEMLGEQFLFVRVEAACFAEDFADNVRRLIPSAADIAPNDELHITMYTFMMTAPPGWTKSEFGTAGKIILRNQTITIEKTGNTKAKIGLDNRQKCGIILSVPAGGIAQLVRAHASHA